MSPQALTVMGALIFCYALVARRTTLANFTAPMLSILAGLVVFSGATVEIHTELVHSIAEIALVIVLFHDASTVQLGRLVGGFSREVDWRWLVLAVLALTVLRMVPVAIAMVGAGLRWPTVAFLGWFGPRGLATIVFGLLALEELGPTSPVIGAINGVLAATVLLSVFAHGVTAAPSARAYGAWAARSRAPVTTEPSVEPLPRRRHWA